MTHTVETTSIDTGSPAFWAQPDDERAAQFATLRRDAPIAVMPPPQDELFGLPQEGEPRGYRAITRYADIRRISRDPATFCSGEGAMFGEAPRALMEATQSFLSMDAPRHTKLRGLVQQAFTPRQVARIEDGIRADAHRIVGEAAPTGGGDFVDLIAKRLPLETISAMVGVADADREAVVEAADAIVSAGDPEFCAGREPLQVVGEALIALSGFARQMAAEREEHPRDDLMTGLVQAEIDGERLTHDEISAWFVLLSVAGNDTSRHTTSHAMRALTTNPGQRAHLAADLGARMPAAVEEFVRWATPVQTFRRVVTTEVELHGETLQPDERVVLFYPSGNQDEEAFDRPERFDVAREPNHHLGFGGGGPHFCLGASLARTQLRAVFTEILTQLPDLEVGEPHRLAGPFIRGVTRMDCSFTPRA